MDETEEIVKTICNMCSTGCGINVHVKEGTAVRVAPMEEHIYNTLCPKANSQAIIEWVYSKDRIAHPIRRINGKFKEVSWDDALDFISGELTRIKRQYGARALAYNTGNAFIRTHTEKVARRFCDLYGTPNYTSGGSFCFFARRFAHSLTFNYSGVTAEPNWLGNLCTIVWGANPEESEHRLVPAIHAVQQRGGTLIVIDPRATSLARRADIHAQLRPGTDCALALGLMNVIIEEELYDKDFVENWTVGFDKLSEHVKRYPPERVAEITWVPADTIRTLARTYAQNKPANILSGVSMEHFTNGVQANRAITILMAITGNIEIPGGNIWQPRPSKGTAFTSLRMVDRLPNEEGIGPEYPIYNQFSQERTAMCIPDAVLDGKPYPLKALIVHGTDPMRIWPNTERTERTVNKLELLIVIDVIMTDTAKLADVVLPATTFLEEKQFKDYTGTGPAVVTVVERAIEPVGNSMEDWRIIAEIGKRMGFGEYFAWKDADDLFRYLLIPTGITLEQLERKPEGILHTRWEPQSYLKKGFNTPSGKVEIYSETLEKYGYEPLPAFEEPAESPISRPDLADTCPFILVTGPKTRYYTHSRFRNVPSLQKNMPEPLLEINTEDAKSLGIEPGDMVTVESPRRSIKLKASPTPDILARVVSVQHGWGEANANLLIDDSARDPISAYPSFRASLCKVTKEASIKHN